MGYDGTVWYGVEHWKGKNRLGPGGKDREERTGQEELTKEVEYSLAREGDVG